MFRTLILFVSFTFALIFAAPKAALASAGSTNNAAVLFVPTVSNEWVMSPPSGCDSNPLCIRVVNTTQWCLRPNLDGSGNPSAVMTLTEQGGIETRVAIGLWTSPVEFKSCLPSGKSAWTVLPTAKVQLSGTVYSGAVPEEAKTLSAYNGVPVFSLNQLAITAAGPATVAGGQAGTCTSLPHVMRTTGATSKVIYFNMGRCPTR